jgi:hypothetical protein
MESNVTDTLLAEILARLDLVVFERLPVGFVRLGSAVPPWFGGLFPEAARDERVTFGEVLPFLEYFLAEAEKFWREGGAPCLRSEVFTATDSSGGELALMASAVAAVDRRFLVLEVPHGFDERRRALQSAREQGLAHEEHIRRTGALQAPVDIAQRLARQLARSGLTFDQQQLAGGVVEHLANLSAAIETLAPLPKGVARRH